MSSPSGKPKVEDVTFEPPPWHSLLGRGKQWCTWLIFCICAYRCCCFAELIIVLRPWGVISLWPAKRMAAPQPEHSSPFIVVVKEWEHRGQRKWSDSNRVRLLDKEHSTSFKLLLISSKSRFFHIVWATERKKNQNTEACGNVATSPANFQTPPKWIFVENVLYTWIYCVESFEA